MSLIQSPKTFFVWSVGTKRTVNPLTAFYKSFYLITYLFVFSPVCFCFALLCIFTALIVRYLISWWIEYVSDFLMRTRCGMQISASSRKSLPVLVLVPASSASTWWKATSPSFRVLGYRPVDLQPSLSSCTTGSRSRNQVCMTYFRNICSLNSTEFRFFLCRIFRLGDVRLFSG